MLIIYGIINRLRGGNKCCSAFSATFCLCLALIAFSISAPINHHDAWALTRGTAFDDVLRSSNINNTNRNSSQTDLISTSQETETGVQQANPTSEFIYGDYGDDEIEGSAGSDHLSGGPGVDIIYGHDGGDYLEGGAGNDKLYGNAGNDALSGGEGGDYFDCGDGRDSVDDFDSSTGDIALNNCEVLENEEAPSH